MPLGLCHQACEHQQFSPLLQLKACEVRSISLDCTQHPQAGVDIVARECRLGFGIRMIHGSHFDLNCTIRARVFEFAVAHLAALKADVNDAA
jgi:hypothetical protein